MKNAVDYTRPLGAFAGAGIGAYLSLNAMHWGFGLVLGMIVGALLADIIGIVRGIVRVGVLVGTYPNKLAVLRGYLAYSSALSILIGIWGMTICVPLGVIESRYRYTSTFAAIMDHATSYEARVWLIVVTFLCFAAGIACTIAFVHERRQDKKQTTAESLADLPSVALRQVMRLNPIVFPILAVRYIAANTSYMIACTRRFFKTKMLQVVGCFAHVNSHAISAAVTGSLLGGAVGVVVGDWRVGAAIGAVACECFYFVARPVYNWSEAKIEALDVRRYDRDQGYYYEYAPKSDA